MTQSKETLWLFEALNKKNNNFKTVLQTGSFCIRYTFILPCWIQTSWRPSSHLHYNRTKQPSAKLRTSWKKDEDLPLPPLQRCSLLFFLPHHLWKTKPVWMCFRRTYRRLSTSRRWPAQSLVSGVCSAEHRWRLWGLSFRRKWTCTDSVQLTLIWIKLCFDSKICIRQWQDSSRRRWVCAGCWVYPERYGPGAVSGERRSARLFKVAVRGNVALRWNKIL